MKLGLCVILARTHTRLHAHTLIHAHTHTYTHTHTHLPTPPHTHLLTHSCMHTRTHTHTDTHTRHTHTHTHIPMYAHACMCTCTQTHTHTYIHTHTHDQPYRCMHTHTHTHTHTHAYSLIFSLCLCLSLFLSFLSYLSFAVHLNSDYCTCFSNQILKFYCTEYSLFVMVHFPFKFTLIFSKSETKEFLFGQNHVVTMKCCKQANLKELGGGCADRTVYSAYMCMYFAGS